MMLEHMKNQNLHKIEPKNFNFINIFFSKKVDKKVPEKKFVSKNGKPSNITS